MPELPEVENCRRQLVRMAMGRQVTAVLLPDPHAVRSRLSTNPRDADPRGPQRLRDAVLGRTLGAPVRRGKRLGWVLGEDALMLHLGMTGRWERHEDLPGPSGRIGLQLDDGFQLWFIDPRRFGCVVVLDASALDAALRKGLGPDPIVDPWTPEVLASRLTGRRAIKVALLDQTVVAGLGNIHAAESLFRAGIDPRRAVDTLTTTELDVLARAIEGQLASEIALLDDQPIHYVTEGGPNTFFVYGREGQSCRRCDGQVESFVQSGRSTFWCPGCQSDPSSA